ncbi:hypothetical protein BDV96DRAFT_571977 [Lophiotrema nucula]|uniref:Uncharacterized protein n=1 Tax=Lophiotrema nucula TaxID=690887 RepID=A0A6A5ZF75_9PLEO|nr:hypothetical protein BDV96DRAFT_571977 [Lophiotrema nucula]
MPASPPPKSISPVAKSQSSVSSIFGRSSTLFGTSTPSVFGCRTTAQLFGIQRTHSSTTMTETGRSHEPVNQKELVQSQKKRPRPQAQGQNRETPGCYVEKQGLRDPDGRDTQDDEHELRFIGAAQRLKYRHKPDVPSRGGRKKRGTGRRGRGRR